MNPEERGPPEEEAEDNQGRTSGPEAHEASLIGKSAIGSPEPDPESKADFCFAKPTACGKEFA